MLYLKNQRIRGGNQSEILKNQLKNMKYFAKEFDLADNTENLATKRRIIIIKEKI